MRLFFALLPFDPFLFAKATGNKLQGVQASGSEKAASVLAALLLRLAGCGRYA